MSTKVNALPLKLIVASGVVLAGAWLGVSTFRQWTPGPVQSVNQVAVGTSNPKVLAEMQSPDRTASGWETSFSPATTSSLAEPQDYFAWQVATGQLNPAFAWRGGIPEQHPVNPNAVWRHIGFNQDQNILAMEFETDTPHWELYCDLKGGGWRVLVRAPKATAWQVVGSWQSPPSETPQVQVFRQKEGLRLPRHWRVEYSGQLAIGVRLNRGDNIEAPRHTMPFPRVVWCGDSFVEGVGGPATWQGFAAQAGEILGVDSHFDASGGTGYVAKGPPEWERRPYGARLANIVQVQPSLVVIYGSVNDSGFPPQEVAAAATKFWSALHKALPTAKIVAIGPVQPNDGWNMKPLAEALKIAASQNDVTFIDATSWIKGTGKVSFPRGDGNADTFISEDGTHPTPAGHTYLAQKVAEALRPLLPVAEKLAPATVSN